MSAERLDAMEKIHQVIMQSTADPGEELIRLGKTLIGVGKILKGKPIHEARRILLAVQQVI
jgi:hypothetical protein